MDDATSVPLWATLLAAGIPTIGAIIAAVIAARSARKARDAQLASETERDLRRQLAGVKGETYEPMIELLRKMLDDTKAGRQSSFTDPKSIDTLSKFSAWLAIYGSDEALTSFHKFMQAAYHSPPSEVLMYYYGSFLVASRKDLGHSDTELSAVDLLGLRISDAWKMWGGTMGLAEKDFLAQFEWEPPWPEGYGERTESDA